MGAGASFGEKVDSQINTIQSYHKEVNEWLQKINEEGNKIINAIKARQYTEDGLCQRIIWIDYNEILSLGNFFPVVEGEDGGRYKAAPRSQHFDDRLKRSKIATCKNIQELYIRKVRLIELILKEIPQCVEYENSIYNGLRDKLEEERIEEAKQLEIFKQMENFNKYIVKRYQLIYNQFKEIRAAKTIPQFNGVQRTTIDMLSKTNSTCQNKKLSLERAQLPPAVEDGDEE